MSDKNSKVKEIDRIGSAGLGAISGATIGALAGGVAGAPIAYIGEKTKIKGLRGLAAGLAVGGMGTGAYQGAKAGYHQPDRKMNKLDRERRKRALMMAAIASKNERTKQ